VHQAAGRCFELTGNFPPPTSLVFKPFFFLKSIVSIQSKPFFPCISFDAFDHQLHHPHHTLRHHRLTNKQPQIRFMQNNCLIFRLKQDKPPTPAKYVSEWSVGGAGHVAQDGCGDRFEIILNDAICRFFFKLFVVVFCCFV
jgi:hypothetical protein